MRTPKTFDEKVDELCPAQGVEFTGDGFRSLCGPIVYLLLWTDDKVLYVGRSINGLYRTCCPDHRALEARNICTKVLIYPCKDAEQSIRLELLLIRNLNPTYNIKK
jgi:hypothetical protein